MVLKKASSLRVRTTIGSGMDGDLRTLARIPDSDGRVRCLVPKNTQQVTVAFSQL